MNIISVDTETFPLCAGNVVPELVCVQLASRDSETGEVETLGLSTEDPELEQVLEDLLTDDNNLLVFLNAGFDLAVIANYFPRLMPLIWAMLMREDRCTDVSVREKLFNISNTGRLSERELPDGSWQKILYSMQALAMDHLGVDLSEAKNSEDSWRTNYSALCGLPFADWPEAAKTYALDDAIYTLLIYESQDKMIERPKGPRSVHGEYFKTVLSFALYLITARGMEIDPVERAKLEEWVAEELAPDKLNLLIESSILRAEIPVRPFSRSYKKTAAALGITHEEAQQREAWTEEEIEFLAESEIKICAAKKSSIDTAVLHAHITDVCNESGIAIKMTDPSGSYPDGQVSSDEKVINKLAGLDKILEQYQHRQSMQQIANTELPRMQAPYVHFRFDPVKATMRTGSSGGKKGEQLYPATNGQNINPRVRQAYVAREGKVLSSTDYSQLELCTLAQKCYELFGHSVLRDLINSGADPHAYLGAQIALKMCRDFSDPIHEMGIAADPMAVYKAFNGFKTSKVKECREIYKKYRTLAKPTGLGYAGGLGPNTFVDIAAKKPYYLKIEVSTAKTLREIWFDTLPEMREYFNWITENCTDPNNGPVQIENDDGTTRRKDLYCYYTPMEHYRAGVSFTEAANGAALQSPAADGFSSAIILVVRACFDPSMKSILYGTHVLNEIHDELIVEHDKASASAGAHEVKRLMEVAMAAVTPDVKITAEPCLMRRWNKLAEPVYDDGILVPWEPEEEAAR